MERRTISLSGRRVAYSADTSSWHPTFEVVFLATASTDRPVFEDVTRGLVSYGNVYIVDLNSLSASTSPRVPETDALLEWTSKTRVRKPLFVVWERAFPVAAEFGRRFPQFTLGIAVLPDPPTTPRRLVAQLPHYVEVATRSVIGAPFRSLRRRERTNEDADDDDVLLEVNVPMLELEDVTDPAGTATSIRTFARSIKPSSPARERLPLRPWAES